MCHEKDQRHALKDTECVYESAGTGSEDFSIRRLELLPEATNLDQKACSDT